MVFLRIVDVMGAATEDDDGAAGGDADRKHSPGIRKLLVKLAARTGLTYLPPRVVSWRYQRGAFMINCVVRVMGDTAPHVSVAVAHSYQASYQY